MKKFYTYNLTIKRYYSNNESIDNINLSRNFAVEIIQIY